ncbi:MFS general substrate transporter [Pseudohyphozyma bogoriensis]|nr:MFS general substrate transporter [Pseudohyphozyma bogoriensis]
MSHVQPKATAEIGHYEHTDEEKGSSTGPALMIDVSKETGDLDVAVEALKGQSLEFTTEEENAVRRKIDFRLIPLFAWACGMQFVDKGGLGAAATYGMRADLKMVGQDYSWAVSGFYFGYLVGAPINGRLLQRFHAGKTIGLNFILWSITLLGMLGVKTFGQAFALRFLLGIFESALAPGLTLITSMWYTQKEQPFRFGLWSCLNGALPIPFIVIYYALGHVKDTSIAPWRLIFALIGSVSFLTGVLLFFTLPDSPVTVTWLNPREKAIAVERVASSQTGIKNAHFKWDQAKEALTDYRVWLLVLQMFTSQAIGSVTTNFLGIVITGFGYTALKAQIYTAPNSAVQFVVQLLITAPPTFIYAFRNQKQMLMVIVSIVATAGTAILYVAAPTAANQHLRLGGCIMLAFSGGNYASIISMIGTNIAGFTKKQVTTSMVFVAYCIVNIITPQTFLGSESPRYHTGLGFVLGMMAAFITVLLISYFSMMAENRRRDRLAKTDERYTTGINNTDLLSGLRDQTDRQNGHHRYSG